MRATASASGSMPAAESSNSNVPKRTILILIWASSALTWSIFTPPQMTFPARILLFQPAWLLRAFSKNSGWIQDLALLLSLHFVYSYWVGAWQVPSTDDLLRLVDDPINQMHLKIFALMGLCGISAGGIVFRDRELKSKESRTESSHEQRIEDQVLPPLLLTSKTTHSRLFPRKHAFSYSYLLVGVPVGIQGRISNVLSVDCPHPGWFAVDSVDYLTRSSANLSLAEKLKRYLHTRGVTDRDYAFAYLVTAPRFLGYSFNPVSFWYLYDSETRLKYMILEVNNTFGERRIYLLRGETVKVDSGVDSDESTENINEGDGKQMVFSDTWQKDFHVSPFSSRKGSYSLRATDPLKTYEETGQVRIDNTIILRSSKDHPKVVARVFSEGKPKDPAQISSWETARFVAVWCWVGFATFPRIVWEAFKLFFKRKLHVWLRPEVMDTNIGRTCTNDEEKLEAFFRAFLTNAVSEALKPLRVIYEPAHSENTEVVLYSPQFTYEEDHKRTLTIKVNSPAFYSRFVHYTHAQEAFERECLISDERNRTARIEHLELLPVLLAAIHEQQHGRKRPARQGPIEQMRWTCLRRLRCPPAAVSYPSDSNIAIASHDTTASRPSGGSELDGFVSRHCDDSAVYRSITIKLFFAERIAFGLPALLEAFDWLLRSAMLLATMIYCNRSEVFDVLRPRRHTLDDVGTVAAILALANSVHLWSFVEG